MALIICPECGREISDKAHFCIGCGLPNPKEFLDKTEKQYKRASNTIFFGEYPQTIASYDAVKEMQLIHDREGYYKSNYDGERYAKIVATPYTKDYTLSDKSLVKSGALYFFKVEPIKWRIIKDKEGKALILTDMILDHNQFDFKSNAWFNSEIRAWLNKYFYNKAFTPLQKTIIENTKLDNKTTGYYPSEQEETRDKIFLLSLRDVLNEEYGFSSSDQYQDPTRRGLTSDYCRCKGVWINPDNAYYGNGYWWLLSSGSHQYYVSSVYSHGYVYIVGSYIQHANRGIRPALNIVL